MCTVSQLFARVLPSGAESALKRTAIIAIEDSYVTEDAMPQVAQMAVLAFLSQRVPSWRPGWSHVQTCVQTLIRAWREPRCFTYSVQYAQTESTIPFGIQDAVHSRDPWAVLSAITDQLRSFAADLQMLRGLARHPEKRSTSTTDHAADPRRVMHLAHCVDQHWAPDIVYFFTPQTVLDLNQPGAKPFGSLLNSLFVYLTGVNPRRRIEHVGGADFRDAFCTEAQQAQQLWLKYRLTTPVHQTVENKQTDVLRVRYTLDRGWLAALVGSIRVGRNGGVLATLRASDPTQIVVVKKPSRDMKSLPLSDKDQENALAEARTKLEHGIRWASKSGKNAIRVPLEEWKKALVKRVGDNTPDQEVKYMIHIDGGNDKKDKHIVKEWDELRHLDIKFPVFDGENPSTGLLSSARQRIEEHIRAMPSVCQHALQSMLSGYHLNLQMPRVGRDGGGTQGAVSAADVGVFHFLRELARLAPAALVHEPGNPTGFTVVCGPLLWYLRDTWMTPILTAEKVSVLVPWNKSKCLILQFCFSADRCCSCDCCCSTQASYGVVVVGTHFLSCGSRALETPVGQRRRDARKGRKRPVHLDTNGTGKNLNCSGLCCASPRKRPSATLHNLLVPNFGNCDHCKGGRGVRLW